MNGLSVITRYFPGLEKEKSEKFSDFVQRLASWNNKINLVSRKDSDEIYLRHILHSLSIYKYISFEPGSKVLDIGTGGGFPGIPLAIMCPGSRFMLVDSIGKKIKAVEDMIEKLQLKNVNARLMRAEDIEDKFDYVVSRAVAPLAEIYKWTGKNIISKGNNPGSNGIICLKGGNLDQELKALKTFAEEIPVSRFFSEDYFSEKKIVFIPVS